jgi:cytochrome c-type biogenesis protein CcmH
MAALVPNARSVWSFWRVESTDSAARPAWLGAALIVLACAAAALGAVRWPTANDDPIHMLTALLARTNPVPSAAMADTAAVSPREAAAARRDALRRVTERHPADGRAWMLLAFSELQLERHSEAAAAIELAVKVSRRVAADPAVWCEWADALGMAQGGTLAGRPTELIDKAVQLNGAHPKALEMAGSAAYERRDFRLALTYWEKLLPQMHPGTRAHAELSAAIERTRRLAATSLPGG